MIKAVSKVEVHFFLVYLGVFEHQMGTQHAPQNSTIWTIWTSSNLDNMRRRNVLLRTIRHFISNTRS